MPRAALPPQQTALQYASARDRIALFMEMRLGKTLVAIRWAKPHPPILVLAPLTVLPAWEQELELEGVPASDILNLHDCFRRGFVGAFRGNWLLANYESIRSHPETLQCRVNTLICDESTRIRNPQAQITKLLITKTAHIPRKAILSGLPAPESPLDYCEQFRFLQGNFMGMTSYWAVRNRYFWTDARGWDWLPRPGVVGKIKEYVHANAFVLTRKQANIGSRKVYETRTIEMTPGQQRVYKKAVKEFALELTDGKEKETQWVITKFLWMARIAGGYSSEADATAWSDRKMVELKTLLEGELKGESVVVWFRFNREISEACKMVGPGVSAVFINGSTSLEERRARLRLFQRRHARVLFAQVKCAKFGLDCSVASTAIYYSNGYDYEDRAQSEDRIVHPQKREPLLYLDLVTQKTVDEDIVDILRTKHASSRIFMTQLLSKFQARHGTQH